MDVLPKVNLNKAFTDLTNSPDLGVQVKARKKGHAKTNEASCSSSSELSKGTCYKKLLKIESLPLITNNHTFNCVLCNTWTARGNGVLLKNCLHSFCKPCLIDIIKNNPVEQNGKVNCPYKPDQCENLLREDEIKTLLSGEEYGEFLKKISENTENLLTILQSMNDLDVLPNYETFVCQLCFDEVNIGEGILLQNCLHNSCKICLAKHIEYAEEYEVKCPHIENDIFCKEFIQEKEMKYLVSAEVFEKHLKKSLKIAENMNERNFHCRGLNCENFVELDETVNSFKCNVCNQVNCVPCKVIHSGKSCKEYQEDVNPSLKDSRLKDENEKTEKMLAKEIANGQVINCPRCEAPVFKTGGCDYITCTACKLGICWITRKPRLSFKRANGEMVEGCNCNKINKCHPNCRFCH